MIGPTHILFGQTVYLAICAMEGHPASLPEALVAAGAAILPDVDSPRGYVGRVLPFVSQPLEFWVGHRTATHALLPQIVIGAALWFLVPFGYWLAVLSGWVSHTLGDMLTEGGVGWFWPGRWRCVLPGSPDYRFGVMSWSELGFLGVSGVLGVLFLPLATEGLGTAGLVRQAIGHVDAARQTYDAEKGATAWTLEVKGKDNATHADISGVYPVRGDWKEAGFLLEAPDGVVSVCMAGCDWHPESAVLHKGEPQVTTSVPLDVGQISVKALRTALEPLEGVGVVLLTGEVTGRGLETVGPVLAVSGEVATLAYLDAGALERFPEVLLRDVALVAQVRHAPGAEVPEVRLEVEAEGPDDLLGKWVVRSLYVQECGGVCGVGGYVGAGVSGVGVMGGGSGSGGSVGSGVDSRVIDDGVGVSVGLQGGIQ